MRGQDLLRTPNDPRLHESEPFYWGAYNMAPWCNRIDAGPVHVGNRTVNLEPNFRDGTAIHGQVYARPWQTDELGSYRVRGGGDAWPWPYEVSLTVTVDETSVRLAQALTNLADDIMPAGIGLHPWFVGTPLVAIRGGRVYPTNFDSRPDPQLVTGPLDLREIASMQPGLDGTWTDIGDPAIQLLWSDSGLGATIRFDAPSPHVTAASPTDIEALAIEPQTQAPQGLRRLLNGEPGALTMLEPGGTLRQVIDINFEMHGGLRK